MQVVNVFLCWGGRGSAPGARAKFVLLGVVTKLAAIPTHHIYDLRQPGLRHRPARAAVLLYVVPFAAGMLILEEFRKRVVRGRVAASIRPAGGMQL